MSIIESHKNQWSDSSEPTYKKFAFYLKQKELMKAIRKIEDVKSGSVTIDLPADFHAKKVEIIVLPVEDSGNGSQSLQDLLLEAPTLTENEVQEYHKVWNP